MEPFKFAHDGQVADRLTRQRVQIRGNDLWVGHFRQEVTH